MLKLVILANELPDDHNLWIRACEKYSDKISYRVVDLTRNNWLEQINSQSFDCLLAKPGGITADFKQLYDERLSILVRELGHRVFPSLDEVLIYENKRFLSFWLDAHKIPHPDTYVFYHREEALEYIDSITFPLVAKLNIGASGSGVTILNSITEAREYVSRIFSEGVSARSGPNMRLGNIFGRAFRLVTNPSKLKNKLSLYKSVRTNPQKNFCLFQEYIEHEFEWRAVRIGDSFFAHKKLVSGGKASGSLLKGYENPPLPLFDFVKELTDRFRFKSQAIDIFQTGEDSFLVNEMQCIFGQSDKYQMLVDEKPGRYVFRDEKWVFEEGMFNTNESYDLRIEWLIDEFSRK